MLSPKQSTGRVVDESDDPPSARRRHHSSAATPAPAEAMTARRVDISELRQFPPPHSDASSFSCRPPRVDVSRGHVSTGRCAGAAATPTPKFWLCDAKRCPYLLYPPNLVGYVRVLLFGSTVVEHSSTLGSGVPHSGFALACLVGSLALDAIDGPLARALDQCTRFGDLLDHYTDHLSMVYLVYLGANARSTFGAINLAVNVAHAVNSVVYMLVKGHYFKHDAARGESAKAKKGIVRSPLARRRQDRARSRVEQLLEPDRDPVEHQHGLRALHQDELRAGVRPVDPGRREHGFVDVCDAVGMLVTALYPSSFGTEARRRPPRRAAFRNTARRGNTRSRSSEGDSYLWALGVRGRCGVASECGGVGSTSRGRSRAPGTDASLSSKAAVAGVHSRARAHDGRPHRVTPGLIARAEAEHREDEPRRVARGLSMLVDGARMGPNAEGRPAHLLGRAGAARPRGRPRPAGSAWTWSETARCPRREPRATPRPRKEAGAASLSRRRLERSYGDIALTTRAPRAAESPPPSWSCGPNSARRRARPPRARSAPPFGAARAPFLGT